MASRTIQCHPKAFPRSFLRRPYPTMSIYSSRPINLNTRDITLTLVQADNMTLSTVFQLHWDDILIPNVLPYLSVKVSCSWSWFFDPVGFPDDVIDNLIFHRHFVFKDLLLLRATCTEGRDLVHSFLQNLRRLDLSFSNIYSKFTVEAFQVPHLFSVFGDSLILRTLILGYTINISPIPLIFSFNPIKPRS